MCIFEVEKMLRYLTFNLIYFCQIMAIQTVRIQAAIVLAKDGESATILERKAERRIHNTPIVVLPEKVRLN